MNRFYRKYACKSRSQWAVITGASSGIGWQYSVCLAKLGWNVVLVSNQKERLDVCERKIVEKFAVQAKSLCIDLSQREAASEVFAFCGNFDVRVLINNAGIFSFRQLHQMPDALVNTFIGLHVRTFTGLCKLFSEDMAHRGGGYILNMSSLAAYMNMPGIAMYQATKAYVRSLSRTVYYEMREQKVGVTVVCPGGVDTSLYGLRPDLLRLGVRLGILTPTEKLVANALKAMFEKRQQYIPGLINRLFIPVMKMMPHCLILYLKRKLARYER